MPSLSGDGLGLRVVVKEGFNVISEFFTNGYVLRHQLCNLTLFKKKMIESSPILEVRETNFRDSTHSSVTDLGLLLLASSQDYRGRLPEPPTWERL